MSSWFPSGFGFLGHNVRMSGSPTQTEPGVGPLQPRPRFNAESTVQCLEEWFPGRCRDLPWRRTRSPWRTLVSELMLQQTQVSRVAERFEFFLGLFPDAHAMAVAGEDAVVAAWEGLGYYRRARLLHAAAVRICDLHDGEVPASTEALLALPGVGRYTAGSIASIAFGRRTPIVDGNVIRVVARLEAIDAAADDSDLVARCWETADTLVRAAASPGVLNESLMELGATVCKPALPCCDQCPLQSQCAAFQFGSASRIPRPKRRTVRQSVHLYPVVIRRGDRVLLRQRPDRGIWAGLWEMPSVESADPLDQAAIELGLGFKVEKLRPIETFKRLLTHREVHFHVYEASTRIRRGHWCDRAAASKLAMAKPMRSLVDRRVWS